LIDVAGRTGIEVREAVVSFRPRTLEFVTKAQVERQSVERVPRIVEIKTVIRLFPDSERRHDGLRKEVIFEVAEVVRVSQEKVRKGKSTET